MNTDPIAFDVVPGDMLVIQLKVTIAYPATGPTAADLQAHYKLSRPSIEMVRPADRCGHESSICPDCLHEWGTDYYVEKYVTLHVAV